MSRIDQLIQNYRRHVSLPPKATAPAAQRIWFAVYPPEDERRLEHRIQEFELATREAGFKWHLIDLHGAFAAWLNSVSGEERDLWFANPSDIDLYARSEWRDKLATLIKEQITTLDAPQQTVLAISGLMELFDYLHVSDLLGAIEGSIPGFLLLFFPGEREQNTYRFLCARDGWDYLAVPIVSDR